MTFKYKRVFITGATSGLGEALVEEISKLNIDALFITGRQEERLENLKIIYQPIVNEVCTYRCDLSSRDERANLLNQVTRFKPDLVINNAGFGTYGDSINFSTADQLKIFEVNGVAVFEITHAIVKGWAGQKLKGTVVNVSSLSGEFTFPSMTLYASTKKAVTEFSQGLDFELKDKGIRVLVFCPGQIQTAFAMRAAGYHLKNYSKNLSVSAKNAAKALVQQINHQKGLLIFDWRNKWLLFLAKLFPKKIIMKILSHSIKKRI